MDKKEIQKQNIEIGNSTSEKKESSNTNIPRLKILSKYPNLETFTRTISSLDENTKNKLFSILESIPEDELSMYLEMDSDNSNLIEIKDINRFIEEKDNYSHNKIFIKNSTDNSIKNETGKDIGDESNKIATENKLEKNNNKEKALKTLNQKIPKLKELFKGDLEIENILNQIEANKEKPDEVLKLVNELLSTKEKATKFFDKIAATGDKELYESTYKSFENLGVSIPPYIPKEIYEIKKDETGKDPRFPDAPEGKVEKRGYLVTYGDKTIDERTGKAYIISDNGYKLETSLNVPNLTEMKVEYQEKRLELLEIINTDKKILELLGNKKKIKQDIADLEKQKKGGLGEDTSINIAINLLEKELEQINDKLKQAVPNYKENQDDLLKNFLEKSIEEKTKDLEKLEEKYKKDLSDLYEKSADKVKENDEKTRQTTLLLDSIGFTLIPQHITDDIIATINKNPLHYGFESRIDLKNGNFGGPNTLPTKERFIKKFNKMISGKEGEPITSEDINNILVKKLEKDKDSQEERNKELLAKFSTYNIMSDLGTWDREKLESNLTLKEKETTNKETK